MPVRSKKFKRERERDPYINGWASTNKKSSHLHAIPFPTDLGDTGRAVCGQRPTPEGWVEEPEVPQTWYCHTCLVLVNSMIADGDERITQLDQTMMRSINDNINAAAERRREP